MENKKISNGSANKYQSVPEEYIRTPKPKQSDPYLPVKIVLTITVISILLILIAIA